MAKSARGVWAPATLGNRAAAWARLPVVDFRQNTLCCAEVTSPPSHHEDLEGAASQALHNPSCAAGFDNSLTTTRWTSVAAATRSGRFGEYNYRCACIAQLVERLTLNQRTLVDAGGRPPD